MRVRQIIALLSLVLLFTLSVFAKEEISKASKYTHIPKAKRQTGEPYYGFLPYVPVKRDYSLELGSMWETQTMYWAGARVGFHIGTCVFSESQTCQQYWDVVGGVGGRDGYTNGLILTGPRWQFINYPSPISPSVILYFGAANFIDDERRKQEPAWGMGYALNVSVHENLDLRFELRAGGGDQEWSQAFVGLGIKIDQIVTHYAEKLKGLGDSTVDIGGKVIKSTGKGLKTVGEGVVDGTGKVIKGTSEGLKQVGEGVSKGTDKVIKKVVPNSKD